MDRNPDVEASIIEPMRRRFTPPRRLQTDEDAYTDTLNAYRAALNRFDRPTLDAAWRIVSSRNETWCWPILHELVRTCEEVYQRNRHGHADAWVQQAEDESYRYTKRFMKASAVATRARAEGWEPELKRFVKAVADVQAQYLEGREATAYDHYTIFGKGERDRESEQAWFDRQKEQAQNGHIRVSVPIELQRRWKAEAEPSRGR